jgi:hypothetical protein
MLSGEGAEEGVGLGEGGKVAVAGVAEEFFGLYIISPN